MTNAELRAAVYQDLTRAHPAQRANVMALVSAQRIVALLDENERLRAEDASWEEREAACCPEDVGFEDMIRYLRADVARLRAALVEIKKPHFGLGSYPMDEQRDYWERWALKYRDIADDALGVKGGDA